MSNSKLQKIKSFSKQEKIFFKEPSRNNQSFLDEKEKSSNQEETNENHTSQKKQGNNKTLIS